MAVAGTEVGVVSALEAALLGAAPEPMIGSSVPTGSSYFRA
jgi:hypothetical protein